MRRLLIALLLTTGVALSLAATRTTAPATAPATAASATPQAALKPVPLLTPEEELNTLRLPDGFRAELVAHEPMVEHTVYVTFDPRGRMWVAEMRSYMPDTSGWGEDKPTGRVSILEDSDGDGRMDKSTVFLDKLVLPRAIGFVKDGVLIASPPKLLFCRDVDGDLKSDEQRVIAEDFGVVDNPENFGNGMLWGLDNWIYNADHDKRMGYLGDGRFEMQPIPVMGQWGISRDDWGRLLFNTNSDYLRGSMVPPHYSARNPRSPISLADVQIAKDQTCFPLIAATVNRGYREGFLRPDGTLKEFTAACAPTIYRANLFPDEFYGNVFVCEATSAFVRRAVMAESDGNLSAKNAYEGKEFLASSYERFRPVQLQVGPEGALYVVDMHHGLIQHRLSITDYAKKQYVTKQLHKHLRTGRIFRIVPESGAPVARPRLDELSPSDLVKQLAHANSWWRDTAQRLLVERADESAVKPLEEMADRGTPSQRLQAVWTLDGMNRLSPELIRAAMRDAEAKIRANAIRLAEAKGVRMLSDILALADDPSVEVQRQFALTVSGMSQPQAEAAVLVFLGKHATSNDIRQAVVSGMAGREVAFLRRLLSDPRWDEERPGRRDAITAIARSITRRDVPTEMIALIELTGEPWQELAMLDALPATRADDFGTFRPIDVPHPPRAVARLASSTDPKLRAGSARVAALFQWPGKPTPPRPKVQPLTPKQQELFELGRVTYANVCAQCHKPDGEGQEGKAPPLRNSPWALGPDKRLIRMVLHGVRGPITINEGTFTGDMPALNALSDEQIAGVLTYVRRSWGHGAPAVNPADVQSIRDWTQARRDGWTEAELLQIR